MKTLTLAAILFSFVAYAKPDGRKPVDLKSSKTLNEQLESIISYPSALKEGNKSGIVILEFHISDQSQIGRVKVFSANQDLNNDIIHQLTGQKIFLKQSSADQSYTVRLYFKKE